MQLDAQIFLSMFAHLVLQVDKFICCPTSPISMTLQTVLFNLVLAIVLEGANDEMKEKHVAQQFCDKAVKLLRSQYRRLAMQRWAAKVRAEGMLERGARAFSSLIPNSTSALKVTEMDGNISFQLGTREQVLGREFPALIHRVFRPES